MVHNLYRFYLYTVFLAMLIFAAIGLGLLLQPLLALTPLRGSYGVSPTNAVIVQDSVFFGVSWLIAGLLGGLHYWLIRRDMHNDPDGASSAIRAFFLNIAELLAAPIAIGLAAYGVIEQLGQVYTPDVSGLAAVVIAMLALVGVLEWERQRTKVGSGLALFFQRLHLYGAQFILLNLLIPAWILLFNQLVDAVAFGGKGSGVTPCGGFVACPQTNILSAAAATLWIVLFWLGYGYIARADTASLLRRIAQYISFAYGVGFVLYGIREGIELGLLSLFGVSVSSAEVISSYNFAALLSLGLVVMGVYALWLRSASRQLADGWRTTLLIGEAIIAALMAGAFFWGAALVLLNLFELPASPDSWAAALALVITGLAYIALDGHLHSRKQQDVPGATDARRGFVFALLGGGILAAAVGGAVALYAVITAGLGSPFDGWPHTARSGLVTFLVGAVILVVYLWLANRKRLFSGLVKRAVKARAPATSTPAVEVKEATALPTSIEEVLDELLAGKISRDEAAMRIREVVGTK